MKLTDSVQFLKGVGPKSVENFHKLGIFTVQDLLLYFPFRYEDFASRSVFELVDGEKATIIGTVVTPANVQYYGFKRNRLSFKIKEGEAVVAVSFLINLIWLTKWKLVRKLQFTENGSRQSNN